MMESPEMVTTLIAKNPDDEAFRALDGSLAGKDETFGVERVVDELENDVNSVRVSMEETIGKVCCQDVVSLAKEGDLALSFENGNECVDKVGECSEVGVALPGLEHAGWKIKDDAVAIDSLNGLEDVPVQQSDISGNESKNFEAMDIQVTQLTDEEQPPLLKQDVKVDVSDDDFLVKKQISIRKDGSFAIGDIVWCMAKNNIWWPALICDPSDVPKQATKNLDSERHLVRHFGTGSKTVIWCHSSHLKHFLECFKEMSSQGKSRSFLEAIEKAAEELGRRVKFEMSCACMSKEIRSRLIGRNKEDFKPWYVSNYTVAHHFDPSKFLERVKDLAKMSNVLDIVELVATRSNLSAYYSYFGHRQMFLRHLRDINAVITAEEGMIVATENTEECSDLRIEKDCQFLDSSTMVEGRKLSTKGTAEKVYESRERKKSKYLSFPFVDPIATKSLLYLTDSNETYGKRSSSTGKRLLGNISGKSATVTSGDLKDLKVSLAQLLMELRDTSRGYFYLNGNTILNSTFDFFCEFRRHTFNDGDSADNRYAENGIIEKEDLVVHDATPLCEIKPAKKRKKSVTSKLDVLNRELMTNQVKDTNLETYGETSVGKSLIKNRKRKESTVASHQTKKAGRVVNMNWNGSSLKPCENSSDLQPKKTKIELENGLLEANVDRHFRDTPAASLNPITTLIAGLPENTNPANTELGKIPTHKKSESPSTDETSSGLPDLNGNDLDHNTTVTSPSPKQIFQGDMTRIPATDSAEARVEEPLLSVILSDIKMKTKMVEESGNNISNDMKAKLESNVNGVVKKITDMTGSSS